MYFAAFDAEFLGNGLRQSRFICRSVGGLIFPAHLRPESAYGSFRLRRRSVGGDNLIPRPPLASAPTPSVWRIVTVCKLHMFPVRPRLVIEDPGQYRKVELLRVVFCRSHACRGEFFTRNCFIRIVEDKRYPAAASLGRRDVFTALVGIGQQVIFSDRRRRGRGLFRRFGGKGRF